MKEIFVDTTGWVALKDISDNLHAKAHALNKELLAQGVNYITSNFVLDESYTLLRKGVQFHRLHLVRHHAAPRTPGSVHERPPF